MSSETSSKRSGGNAGRANQTPGFLQKVKVKPKVSPIRGSNFEYANEASIGNSFVVVIASPSGSTEVTFHDPIGVTDLTTEDWVATPTMEMPQLLARKVDPNAASLEEQRREFRMDLCVEAGLLTRIDDELHYPNGCGARAPILRTARSAAKEAAPAGTKVPNEAYINHLPQKVVAYENAVRAHLVSSTVVKAASRKFPDSAYRTRSGPLADRDQEAVAYLKGMNTAQAQDTVLRRVFGQ